VVSEAIEAPTKTPCCQSNASYTSGPDAAPPAKKESRDRHAGGVLPMRRTLGDWLAARCSARSDAPQDLAPRPRASLPVNHVAGGDVSLPSHHGSREGVMATLVKMVFSRTAFITLGLVCTPVPGATPKKPFPVDRVQ